VRLTSRAMSTHGEQPAGVAVGTAPPPAAVPGNDWTLLDVPAPEAIDPETAISVVIEGPERDALSSLSAAALGVQSYPAGRIEVIGPEDRREPSGELVILVGSGTVPDRGALAAHARWHGVASDIASLGPAVAIDGADLDAGAVRAAQEASELAALCESRRLPGDDPFELVLDLTRELTDPEHGLLMGAALGTLCLRRETLAAIGGLAPASEGPWTPSRLDLVLRLWCFGALFVPEPLARSWSPDGGERAELGRAIAAAAIGQRSLELEYPELASAVPLPPLRSVASPRRFRRPSVAVNVDAAGEPASEVLATLEPMLGGRFGDFELRIQLDEGSPGRAEIAAAVDRDARARFAPPSTEGFCASPFQVFIPAVARPDPRTLGDLHHLLVVEGAGALHVTVPGAPPQDTMIEALATGAFARSARVAETTGEDPEVVLGNLFGERWLSGVEVSVRRHGVTEPHVTEHGPLAAATDVEHERIQHLRFRDRGDDLEELAAAQAARVLSERLRVREERLKAERLEAKLRRLRG
jgi:hypothetical protein